MEKGLIIRTPWIDLILQGKKTWEMRTDYTKNRGTIGLIRKGTGMIIGTARLIESRPPLTRENYMSYEHKHAIPASMLEEVMANRWVFPWVLSEIEVYPEPVPANDGGGVIFVTLNANRPRIAEKIPAPHLTKNTILPKAPLAPAIEQPIRSNSQYPEGKPEDTKSIALVEPLFTFRPETAKAFGRPIPNGGFLILAGSTTMRNGSANVKRDKDDRDLLLERGTLVLDDDQLHYRFAVDHSFSSASKAAGVVKDGNASGRSLWIDESTGRTLKDYLSTR